MDLQRHNKMKITEVSSIIQLKTSTYAICGKLSEYIIIELNSARLSYSEGRFNSAMTDLLRMHVIYYYYYYY